MTAKPPPSAPPNRTDPVRLAFVATCGIFVAAFITMIVIRMSPGPVHGAAVILDTCEWLVAVTATGIVGLITRSRK